MSEQQTHVLYTQAVEATQTSPYESLPLDDLLARVRTAHDALRAARREEGAPAVPVQDADAALWEQSVANLRPTEVSSDELGNWYGKMILQILQNLKTELQSVAKMDLKTEEKALLYPVQRHPEKIADGEVNDLSSDTQTENDTSFMRSIYPQLAAGKGKFWACGGLRGALVAAGPIDTRLLFFHSEFAVYMTRYGSYPKGEALSACQSRATTRLHEVQKHLDSNPTMLSGVQYVLGPDGYLDWVPIIRQK